MRESWKQALLENLRQRGIVDEAAAAAVMQQSPAPWFVHLFAGLAAWLAALMLILSSALALAHDSLFGAILIGAMLLGLAVWLLRQPGIFLAQMGLALSLAGQGMLVYAVGELSGFDELRSCALSGALVALGMLWVPAPALHRVLCALGVFAGVAVLIGFNGWLSLYGLLLAGLALLLWLRRGAWAGAPQALVWRAVAAAATLAAMALPLIARRDWTLPLGRLADEAAWVLWLYPGRSHPAAGRCALAGAGPVAGEGGIGGYCLPGCRCTWLGGSGAAGDRCPVAGFVPGMRAPLVRPGRTGGDPVSRRPVLQPASQSVAQVDGADAQRRGASAAALAGAALLGGWQ